MQLDPDIDRKHARLAPVARGLVRADQRRILLVGARGWIGRTVLALLHEALGPSCFANRVVCFGSASGEIALEDGTAVLQQPLRALDTLPAMPSLLLHLAFLTKDRIASMDADIYASENRALSRTVLDALDPIGVDRLFVASSGAAAFADDAEAAADLRLYGSLKREDEEAFAGWALTRPDECRAAIGRIYSVSGPYINKPQNYALASFILDALAGRPIEVRAHMPVFRSYAAVRDLVSLVFAMLLADRGDPVLRFDTGGEALELETVARLTAALFHTRVHRQPITEPRENRYVGNEESWQRHLAEFAIEPLPLAQQIAETAAWLARVAE